ncbi:EthD domain-containing protein [Paracoccaceae bacterium]|nr:EthD domain-containing protein [Paracoccaceae bacterium]
MINAITIIKKKQNLTYENFQNYWKNEHAKIVTRSPLVGTYVQSHPIYNDKLTFEDTVDGIAEIWFEDTNAMRTLAATKEYRDIQDDEKVFIDGSAVRLIIAEDIITFEGGVSDHKLIIFINKSSSVELTDFRNDLVDKASHYSKKNLNRMKVSLPKFAGYKGDKSPAWDAILTFWLDFQVDQQYIDDVVKDFSSFSNNIIAKLCNSVVVQEK